LSKRRSGVIPENWPKRASVAGVERRGLSGLDVAGLVELIVEHCARPGVGCVDPVPCSVGSARRSCVREWPLSGRDAAAAEPTLGREEW